MYPGPDGEPEGDLYWFEFATTDPEAEAALFWTN